MDIWQRLLLLKKSSEESVTEIRFLYLKIRHPAKPLSKNQIQLLLQSSFCFHLPVWPHLKRHGEYSKQKCRKETLTLIWQVFNFQHTPFFRVLLTVLRCWGYLLPGSVLYMTLTLHSPGRALERETGLCSAPSQQLHWSWGSFELN